MAAGRQRAEWFRVGVAVGWTKGVSPLKVIPRCYHPRFEERNLTPEQEEIEAERSWRALDSWMEQLGKQHGRAG